MVRQTPMSIIIWRLFLRTLGHNTRFWISPIVRLPKEILSSGAKEPIISSTTLLSKYALNFKRKGFHRYKEEAKKHFDPDNYLILGRFSDIQRFPKIIQDLKQKNNKSINH